MRRIFLTFIAVATSVLIAGPARAGEDTSCNDCDFLTGGGFIITTASDTHAPAKANFGIGGGCKHGSPTWGHLEYIDHGTGLNVHWLTITAYRFIDQGDPSNGGQPTGSRLICGTARTNQFGDVAWAVLARDTGEPGSDDEFTIWLTDLAGTTPPYYTTSFDSDHTLGGSGSGGGNIQLHKPNPSTEGSFGGDCPAFPGINPGG
jgi:hypothetical protein